MGVLYICTECLICQNKYATATSLSDMVDGEFSHDKGTRFLRQGDFDSKILWKYVKSAVCESETQNKEHRRKATVNKNQHFRQLIQQACTNHVLFERVLADNWFGSKANMAFIHDELQKSFMEQRADVI